MRLANVGVGLEIRDAEAEEETGLILAAERGHKAVVKELLKRGVPLDERDDVGATALRYARNGRFRGIAKLLQSQGAHERSP